jgi:hypothetical protein
MAGSILGYHCFHEEESNASAVELSGCGGVQRMKTVAARAV